MTNRDIKIGLGALILAMAGLVSGESPPIVGNAVTGKEKSTVCATCHGPEGNGITSAPIWPKIAGQSEEYLINELTEFHKGDKGKRFDPVMYGMTQNLSEQDIADLAAYYASQAPTPGVAKEALVALGEKIYRGGNVKSGVPACSACHGPRGEGNAPANFPRVSGQNAEYIVDQLKKFKNGVRSDDTNAIMRDISKHMTDEEIQAVSSYVSGLH